MPSRRNNRQRDEAVEMLHHPPTPTESITFADHIRVIETGNLTLSFKGMVGLLETRNTTHVDSTIAQPPKFTLPWTIDLTPPKFASPWTIDLTPPKFAVPWTIDPSLPWFALLPRRDQKDLSATDRSVFNTAIQHAIDAGVYQQLAAIHADMSHDMHHVRHGQPSAIGMLRFLPWHRVFLYKLEELLQAYQPGLRIPYWNWAVDQELPSWVLLPRGVTRGPDPRFQLPDQSAINRILSYTTYEQFSNELETAHDTVHMWVGGNTMPNVMVSPNDPLFWLHHANVDRIWAIWQEKPLNQGKLSPITGVKVIMDPWPYSVTDVARPADLLYYYA